MLTIKKAAVLLNLRPFWKLEVLTMINFVETL